MDLLFDPFETFFGTPVRGLRGATFVPAADVALGDNDLVLTFDMPGLSAEDIEIEVVGDTLTVRGERGRPAVPDGMRLTHAERGFGRFERTVRIPSGVDPDSVTATMDNGVLSLLVPKPERLKPRTIRIGSGDTQKELTAA